MSVYFAQNTRGDVKIGTAVDVEARLRSLETALTEPLQLLRIVDGGKKTEKWLHKKFAGARIRGEWFYFCSLMLTIVPPDEIPPKPKTIYRWKSTRAYILACDKSGLLDDEMRKTYGLPLRGSP